MRATTPVIAASTAGRSGRLQSDRPEASVQGLETSSEGGALKASSEGGALEASKEGGARRTFSSVEGVDETSDGRSDGKSDGRPDDPPSEDARARRSPAVEWATSRGLVDYAAAVAFMEARAQAIAEGRNAELVWLLEHPAIYTAGTSARPDELIAGNRLPVFHTGRGGRYAYHGPGQRVIYVMLDVKKRGGDVRSFVASLEDWIIGALGLLGVEGARRPGRVGVWVEDGASPSGEAKIAAIGLRLRRWVSLHGISLNVSCDLAHYDGIVPCGITGHGVTSLAALKRTDEIGVVDRSLRVAFEARFGATRAVDPPLPDPQPAKLVSAG